MANRPELTSLQRWALRALTAAVLTFLVVLAQFSQWGSYYEFRLGDGFGPLDLVGLFTLAMLAVIWMERLRRP